MADGRYILLVEKSHDVVFPIVDDDEICCIYASSDEAEQAAENTMACRAWPYAIVNLDDIM
ncbi:hypothetical protein MW7_007185 [Imbroritus primus]|uniref:Uncharacterized protein n=1 Tax=Imbroritus primus TaxID=3058603 RepID=A0ACD3SR19_9BURK|nr:hypothetical protein MW7_007185 [Burkholderiaceae bacterium PBA]